MQRRKTDEERAATRRAQNERYKQRKLDAGLKRVSLWMPGDMLTAQPCGLILTDGTGVYATIDGWTTSQLLN